MVHSSSVLCEFKKPYLMWMSSIKNWMLLFMIPGEATSLHKVQTKAVMSNSFKYQRSQQPGNTTQRWLVICEMMISHHPEEGCGKDTVVLQHDCNCIAETKTHSAQNLYTHFTKWKESILVNSVLLQFNKPLKKDIYVLIEVQIKYLYRFFFSWSVYLFFQCVCVYVCM